MSPLFGAIIHITPLPNPHYAGRRDVYRRICKIVKAPTDGGPATASCAKEAFLIQTGMRSYGVPLLVAAGLLMNRDASGQLDPEKRELIQLGFGQSFQGAAPIDGYGYYYLNEPNYFG